MYRKSTRLRAKDVRDVMRLVGEVRDLGSDRLTWRYHACIELAKLTDATVGMSIQAIFKPAGPTVAIMVDAGWECDRDRQIYYKWLGSPEFGVDPMMAELTRLGNSTFAWPRWQEVPDRTWYASPSVSDVRRTGGVDDCLISSVSLPDGGVDQFALQRPWGGTRFTRYESVLLSLFHRELQRYWQAAARKRKPIAGLPVYLRRTLTTLVDGGSEKEAASQLNVKPSTLHGYVKQLHSRLGVASRRELIDRFGNHNFTPNLTVDCDYRLPALVAGRR